MPRNPARSPFFTLWVALLAALVASGCARLPRIDPSGRRLLIWPDPVPVTAPASPLGIPGLGNIEAPPVFAGAPSPTTPGLPVTQPPGSVAPTPFPRVNRVLTPAKEELSITPSRLLAPVGSEVILKAGVCAETGYLRTNRRIEWTLGQEGSGQFVTVGEQGEMDMLRLPWQRPNKHDNSYAVGYTAPFNVCLRRGNDDASDDVQVERGEAWITLTSASEGVSYVTATAPETGDWDARRATATVYWVDARWRLPQPVSVQPGQTATLTTTVTRESDGTPIAGWIVRYEVLRGETARLGYASGQTSEITTDAQGNARIDVTPTDNAPGSALVKATVIRPASSVPMPAPRLELGGGEVTVDWSPAAVPAPIGGAPVTPPPLTGPPASSPDPPAPFQPPPSGPTDPLGSPADRLGPRIEVSLRSADSGSIVAGQPIPVMITLLNTGDEPTQNLSLEVQYDQGLSHPGDPLGKGRIKFPRGVPPLGLSDLTAGESIEIPLTMNSVLPGRQCLNATVGADRMAAAFDRLCVQVEQPTPPPQPQLRIETVLDAVGTVGERVSYRATVYNDGPVAVENLRVEILNREQLDPVEGYPGGRERITNGVAWPGLRIEPRGSIAFAIDYDCLAEDGSAEVQIDAIVDGEGLGTKLDGVEIRAAAPAEPPPIRRPDLEATLGSTRNPALVGLPATLNVTITNTTSRDLDNVQYRLVFGAPELIQPNPPPGAQPDGNTLVFPPIGRLAAGETFRTAIPYTPLQDGVVPVELQMRMGSDGPVEVTRSSITISGR